MSYEGCACYWLEPTGVVRLALRQFTFSLPAGEEAPRPSHRNCPAQAPGRGCDATVDLEDELPLALVEHEDAEGERYRGLNEGDRAIPHDDPRWPLICSACAQPFLEDDQWQVNFKEVYTRSDTGETVAFRGYGDPEFRGALFDSWYLHGGPRAGVGPDGIALVAILPNGIEWHVDGEATGGGYWSRVGDPREPLTLSVTPSIQGGDYHGYLTSGRLTAG